MPKQHSLSKNIVICPTIIEFKTQTYFGHKKEKFFKNVLILFTYSDTDTDTDMNLLTDFDTDYKDIDMIFLTDTDTDIMILIPIYRYRTIPNKKALTSHQTDLQKL